MCPRGFKYRSGSDGIVGYGITKERVFLVIWDQDTSTAHCFKVYLVSKLKCLSKDLHGLVDKRGINRSQFFRTSILLSFEVIFGTYLSSSGLRYVYVWDTEMLIISFLRDMNLVNNRTYKFYKAH